MNKRFFFNRAHQWLEKLAWELKRMEECQPGPTPARVYMAMNFAISAWHLVDWVWNSATPDQRSEFQRVLKTHIASSTAFGLALKGHDSDFYACSLIANELKHFSPRLTNGDDEVVAFIEPISRVDASGTETQDWIPKIRTKAGTYTDIDFGKRVITAWIIILEFAGMHLPDISRLVQQELLEGRRRY